MRTRRTWSTWVGLGLCLLLLASACGTSQDDGQGAPTGAEGTTEQTGSAEGGGTMILAFPVDFDSLDPHIGAQESSLIGFPLIFDTLVGVDKDANPAPGLASEWEVSDDGLTYTFHLREGVQWHSGRSLTAEDIKFNLDRVMNPETGSQRISNFRNVESVEAPDESTVVINMSQPDAQLITAVADQGILSMIDPDSVSDDNEVEELVGTGPFKFESYTPGDRMILSRNDDYWDGPANVDGLEIRFITDNVARQSALDRGEVHFVYDLPSGAFDLNSDSFEIKENVQNRANLVAFNSEKPPFDDVRLREALSLAISRDDIAQAAWDGHAVPTRQAFHEGSFWYVEGEVRTEADMERAQELIEQVGTEGQSITLYHHTGLGPGGGLEAQVIQSAWTELGLDVTLEAVDQPAIQEVADTGEMGTALFWFAGILDPDRPYNFLATDHPYDIYNGSVGTEETDEILTRARQASDREQRKELYGQLLEYLTEESFGAFYTVRTKKYVGISNQVSGFEPGAFYIKYDGGGIVNASLAS